MFHLEYKFYFRNFGVLIIKVHNNRYHHIIILIIVTHFLKVTVSATSPILVDQTTA